MTTRRTGWSSITIHRLVETKMQSTVTRGRRQKAHVSVQPIIHWMIDRLTLTLCYTLRRIGGRRHLQLRDALFRNNLLLCNHCRPLVGRWWRCQSVSRINDG